MNVEDSYEGALRRLERLQLAGLDLRVPPPEPPLEFDESERARELEELASLACDENERLKQELNQAHGAVERLTQELDGTRSEIERLAREVGSARGESERVTRELSTTRSEVDRLQRLAATLQEMVASLQSSEPAPSPGDVEPLTRDLMAARGEIERLRQLVAAPQSADEALNVPRQRGTLYVVIALVGVGAIAFLLTLRPWENHPVPTAALPSAPVLAAPPPQPVVPKVEPTIPKVATTIPKVEPVRAVVAKTTRRHVAKHHPAKRAQKKKRPASMAKSRHKLDARSDDPLSGLGM